MFTDILTIVRKELKEILLIGDGRGRGRWGMLIFLGVFGIYLPLSFGRDWVISPLGLVPWAWIPYILVSGIVADSFAGERERHTLETLLATRLSDRAILFGKLLASVAYGCVLTWSMVLLAIITTNVTNWEGVLILPSLPIGLGVIGFSLLASLLSAGVGVLISLRSSTVRQAAQTQSLIMFVLVIPLFAIQFLPPEWLAQIMTWSQQINGFQIALYLALGLALLDSGLVLASMAVFQRNRLVSD